MTRLPHSVDDLRGLRAARWVRESTAGQHDRFGPDAQREQQDRAIERYGVADTGLSWSVAHSGRTIARTGQWGEMMAAAGRDYDVLLVGYVSRFARDLRTAVNARHDLHAAGAALLFCDERVLSSDEDAWEQWAREAVEAEAYSRRLAKRIREGYAAKFRRLDDQAGPTPIGFVRTGPNATLAVDPATITIPVAMFQRYSTGMVSYEQLGAEFGMEAGAVREILRNPVYNGWVRRHRRTTDEQLRPAAWRDDPPVSDALWSRVEAVKGARTRSSGPRYRGTPPMLSGLLWCACGEHIRSNGTQGAPPRAAVIHPSRSCTLWGDRRTRSMDWYERCVDAQVRQMDLDDATIARVVAALADPPAVPEVGDAELGRRRRSLALAHANGKLTDEAYLAAVGRLRRETSRRPDPVRIDAAEVVERLRQLPALWERSGGEERRELARSIYARIEVAGERFTRIDPTPDAVALGLPLVLPELAMVSREGDKRSNAIAVPMPVSGRVELMSRRRSA